MKIENNFNQQYMNTITGTSGRTNNRNDNVSADSLVDAGVSMEISKRGRLLAGELEPFIDTYETTNTLLKGVGHIGSEKMMNGDFADTLADNYQNELQKLKDNYSGDEFDKQLTVLDKAYEEAAQNVSQGYVKQLRLLTGDIVLKPQTGISYSSEAEAKQAYEENNKKSDSRGTVIDSALSDTIEADVKNILLQLKNADLFDQDGKSNLCGNFLSYGDIKKLGSYLSNGVHGNEEGISDFSKLLLNR